MFKLFKRGGSSGEGHVPERTRPSRGWADTLTYLKAEPARSLRVLDFGATSPVNINLLTSLGHSVYMANIVGDAQRPDWLKAPAEGARGKSPEYDTDRFRQSNLDFPVETSILCCSGIRRITCPCRWCLSCLSA